MQFSLPQLPIFLLVHIILLIQTRWAYNLSHDVIYLSRSTKSPVAPWLGPSSHGGYKLGNSSLRVLQALASLIPGPWEEVSRGVCWLMASPPCLECRTSFGCWPKSFQRLKSVGEFLDFVPGSWNPVETMGWQNPYLNFQQVNFYK